MDVCVATTFTTKIAPVTKKTFLPLLYAMDYGTCTFTMLQQLYIEITIMIQTFSKFVPHKMLRLNSCFLSKLTVHFTLYSHFKS